MSLREELKNINEDTLTDVFGETIGKYVHEADEVRAIESVLNRDYHALYAASVAVKDLLPRLSQATEQDARLIAAGMLLGYAILKDCAERQLVDDIDIESKGE